MSIKQNLERITSHLPGGVTFVAVTKSRPIDKLQEVYECGFRIFGENRHKELVEKYNQLPKDISWHYIGSLQRTNVKYVVPIVDMIHSVDSQKLLEAINKESLKCGRVIDVLLEIHLAQELTKSGWNHSELVSFLGEGTLSSYANVRVRGVMTMASHISCSEQIKSEFVQIKEMFDSLKEKFFKDASYFDTISAGMSNDYTIAIEAGSNMVRVGSSIFE